MAYALPPPTQAHHHPYWDLEPTSFPPLVIAVSNAPKSAESPGSRRIGVIGAIVYFLPSETVSYKVTLGIGILGRSYLDQTKSKSKAKNPHSPHLEAKSEIAVIHIQILLYYSTLVQTNISLVQSFRDQIDSKYEFLTCHGTITGLWTSVCVCVCCFVFIVTETAADPKSREKTKKHNNNKQTIKTLLSITQQAYARV